MTSTLWGFVLVQMLLGLTDTLVHHEGTERLAWRPSQQRELQLHGLRNLLYAVLFAALGWFEPHGLLADSLLLLLAVELGITLWDFVEEDRTRRLPATERVLHTVLTLNYGVILALLVPLLLSWAALPTALPRADHGWIGWLCAAAAMGVILSGMRDLAAARRAPYLGVMNAASLAAELAGPQHVVITGGTGFVGSRLVAALGAAGHQVTVLTRNRKNAAELPAPVRIVTSLDQIGADERVDAVVNLAGEPISNGLWTKAKRERIVRSRVDATRKCLRLIERLQTKPRVLVSGSAIGWYGLRGDEPLDEGSAAQDCFSHQICAQWEEAARGAGIRTVLLRIGLVLDSSGGMLARMLTPFEFGLGGPFGNGRHWMSWIHRDDLVRLIVHAIADPRLEGPVNGTAPMPVTNREFSKALGRALRRPVVLPVPALPLRLVLGDFAKELLLSGQRVLPRNAEASGFVFTFSEIDSAFTAIVGRGG